MSGEHDAITQPKEVARFIVKLYADGNMGLEFSGPLASAPVAEHMLKKALQGLDDERFAALMKMQEGMGALVKVAPGAALKSIDLGRRNHG